MKSFPIGPASLVHGLHRNADLAFSLSAREVSERYRESFLGFAWAIVQPLLIIAIYIFVFAFVFKSRWPGGSGSKTEFALVLFAGLLVFNMFSEILNRSPQLILEKRNFVKRVVFPLEIVAFVCAGTAAFNLAVNTIVWLVFYVVAIGAPHLTALLFPVVLIPFVCFMLGVSWLFAAVGVYIRDLSQVTAIITTGAMFLTPIFYPPTFFPEDIRYLLNLNPLTIVVDQVRDVLMWGRIPDPLTYLGCLLVGVLVMWVGYATFQKTRKGFSDVL